MRRDGTNVLKELSNLNRKPTQGISQSNISLTKSKAIPQTTSNSNTSKTIKKIPSTKGPTLFFYPSSIPTNIQDVPTTVATTRNNVPTKLRPANDNLSTINSSANSMSKHSKSKSPGPAREYDNNDLPNDRIKIDSKPVTRSESKVAHELSIDRVERTNTSERAVTPVRQLTIKDPNVIVSNEKTESSQAQNGSGVPTANELDIVITTITKVNSNTRVYSSEKNNGLKKILTQFKSDRRDQGSQSPRSLKKPTTTTSTVSTTPTILPNLRPPLRENSKNSKNSTSNHGSRKNSPTGIYTSQLNFEFCKKSDSAAKLGTRPTTRENSPRGVTPKKELNLMTDNTKVDNSKTPSGSKSSLKKVLSTSSPKTSGAAISSLLTKTSTLMRNENIGTMSTKTTSSSKGIFESDRTKSLHKIVSPVTKTPSSLSGLGLKTKNPYETVTAPSTRKADQSSSLERKPNMMQNLSDEERHSYGDRFPLEYMKLDFLGRGGFAIVWLGASKKSGKKYAVKQILKNNLVINESQIKELKWGKHLFENGGPKEKFKSYEGIKHIATFADYRSTKFDDWHVFELCGTTLSKQVFDIKGEFFKSERIYGIKHLPFHKQLKGDNVSLKSLIKQISEVLELLADEKIVHCDLKPDNILIDMKEKFDDRPFNVKIIDFGSAYEWNGNGHIGMATPEYMPPEFLHALFNNNGQSGTAEFLAQTSHPWSLDVWSLGALVLEIITGIPLWLSLKCRVEVRGKDMVKTGLFAVKGRGYDKIYIKQKIVMETLDEHLAEYLDEFQEHLLLKDLINKMMKIDPLQRISPAEILKHPYISSGIISGKNEDQKDQTRLDTLQSQTQTLTLTQNQTQTQENQN